MATKPKKPARYDLKAADRRRNIAIQIGLTAVVVVFAVALVLYIVTSNDKTTASGDTKAIRVTSSKLITKDGSTEPKAVVSLYEDFLCPACGTFEKQFGQTVSMLIDSGAIAADYHMVAILDRPTNQKYSSRAGNAGYCVADESVEAFRRFHTALYSEQTQPKEDAATFPDDTLLIEQAAQAGAAGGVPACITGGKYLSTVADMAKTAGIHATPTIRINGQDYKPTTPQALIDTITGIVGTVPGLNTPGAPATP